MQDVDLYVHNNINKPLKEKKCYFSELKNI